MVKHNSVKRKTWLGAILAFIVDLFAAFFGGNTLFGNSSKGKSKK